MATSDPGPVNPAADTPIMKQYQAAKARYPRHLLFFRIGDFYELFYDDAKTVARVLGLTLTSRNKGPDAIPMAGVPAHSAEQYLARLLRMGMSVAICDQTEDASQAKGLVKRDVTRVVTPGTVLEENLLDAKKANRLVAILPDAPLPPTPSPARGGGERRGPGGEVTRRFGLASVDLANGCIFIQELVGEAALRSEFARLAPSECLLPDDPELPNGQKVPPPIAESILAGAAVSRLRDAAFFAREAHANIIARFSENGRDRERAASLKKFAKELPLAMSAAGALAGYIDETHPGGKVLLSPPQPFDPEEFLLLGDSAIRSLELTETLRSRSSEGSLLWAIDRTRTAAGGRCLREWLIRPLRNLKTLTARQDAVAALVERTELRDELRELLKTLADLERIAARLSAARATPRDLIALKETLLLLPKLHERLAAIHTGPLLEKTTGAAPARTSMFSGEAPTLQLLEELRGALTGFDALASRIAAQLRDDCSNTIADGALIKSGVDAELDRLQSIATGGKDWIARFESGEAERTGIGSLKVGYNRVFGYYIEISRANSKLVPKDYERRQTLTNAERYTTPALKEREAEVLGAEEKIRALEQKLFLALRDVAAESAAKLLDAGHALAQLDALASMAEVAQRRGHVRPSLTNSGRLSFEQMRHPVLEETLPKGNLVPNDLTLAAPIRNENGKSGAASRSGASEKAVTKRDAQIILLTGPNMAGKSTYIRAAALCTILAQMGAFVPAEAVEVGLVDRIFTRVGAADDLAGGRSTFMLEMTEVAEILSACTSRSLVILDEVGRGTSTYDGVSLAWAIVEHLHEGQAAPRTLFATHYHELSALEEELPRVRNASAAVKEWQGEITFLHRIVPGPSERSFGIHVARLAGLPAPLLDRAKAILRELENEGQSRLEHLTDGGAQLLSGGAEASLSGRKRRAFAKPAATDGQLQLFEPDHAAIDPAIKAIIEELRAVDPHAITPMQALAILEKLVKKTTEL